MRAIWSVKTGRGEKFAVCNNLTKKQAKAMFERLARDTTTNATNDYLDLITLTRRDDDLITVLRVGAGEYTYWHKSQYVPSGYEAAEIVATI